MDRAGLYQKLFFEVFFG